MRLKAKDSEAITTALKDNYAQKLRSLKLTAISLNDASLNNMSQFCAKQNYLKYLTLITVAGTLNYTNHHQIVKKSPEELGKGALSVFFRSLGKCAKKALEELYLGNFRIGSETATKDLNKLICEQAQYLKIIKLENMLRNKKYQQFMWVGVE